MAGVTALSLAGAIALSLAVGIGFVWYTGLANLAAWGFLGERRRQGYCPGAEGTAGTRRRGLRDPRQQSLQRQERPALHSGTQAIGRAAAHQSPQARIIAQSHPRDAAVPHTGVP